MVVTNSLLVQGGAGTLAYGQIGNGGASSDASLGGNVTVTVGKDAVLSGVSATGAYAQIGNGDDLRNVFAGQSGTGNRSGDIQVATGTDITLTGAMIGNLNSTSAATGVSGITQIGVSRDDPTDPSVGSIIADAGSEFQGTDQFRVYLPRRGNNQSAAGAKINGEVWSGAPADPSPTQRIDERTINIIGITTATPAEHTNVIGSGLAPTNAANFAFYYDTIALSAAPPVIPVIPGNGGNNGNGNGGNGGNGSGGIQQPVRGPNYASYLPDDRTLDDWLRDEEKEYSGPGEAVIYYEGYEQYGPNGESIFNSLFTW